MGKDVNIEDLSASEALDRLSVVLCAIEHKYPLRRAPEDFKKAIQYFPKEEQ